MIPIQFLGSSYPTEDVAVCSRRVVNVYLEADESYKNKAVGLGFPGYTTAELHERDMVLDVSVTTADGTGVSTTLTANLDCIPGTGS